MDSSLLTECKACNAKVSRSADRCPVCRHPAKSPPLSQFFSILLLVVAAGLLISGYLSWRQHQREVARAEGALIKEAWGHYGALAASGAPDRSLCLYGRHVIQLMDQYRPTQAEPGRARVAEVCTRAGI